MSNSHRRSYPHSPKKTCSYTSMSETLTRSIIRAPSVKLLGCSRTQLVVMEFSLHQVRFRTPSTTWTRTLSTTLTKCAIYYFRVQKKMMSRPWLQTSLASNWSNSKRSPENKYLLSFGCLRDTSEQTPISTRLKAYLELQLLSQMSVSWRFTWVKRISSTSRQSRIVTLSATTGKSWWERCRTCLLYTSPSPRD